MELLKPNTPATRLNRMAKAASVALGGAAAYVASVGSAFAASGGLDGAEKTISDALTGLFGNIQGIAGPLVGVAIAICLIMMALSSMSGNAQGIRAWRSGAIIAGVVLILILVVPSIVSWIGDFGKDINGNVDLSSALS